MNGRGQQAHLDDFDEVVRLVGIRFASNDGAFVVADVECDDGSDLAVIGALSHLEIGERARIQGRVEVHPAHGPQVRVSEAEPLDPAETEGVRRYLMTMPGIGRGRADSLLERFGGEVFSEIDRDPTAAFASVRGVGPVKAAEAAEAWTERRSQRRVYALLAPHGLARFAPELIALHGGEAEAVVRADPYSLTSLHGVGFLAADQLAVASGIDPEAPERVEAALIHSLRVAENRGHSHLPRPALAGSVGELLAPSAPTPELLRNVIDSSGELVVEADLVYRGETYASETELAAMLAELAAADAAFEHSPRESELAGLTDDQAEAVANALGGRISVITGGPGTGKTHLTDALARAAGARNLELRLLAPTGRAARRLTEATAVEASTIHKALEWIPGLPPGRDASSPIDAELVIVDEASMLSLEIAHNLVAAVGPDAHLVLIGDIDQLPPIGPGKPFCELIESGIAPTVRLEHVFRQAARSMIVAAAHEIRAGRPPHSEPGPEEIEDFFVFNRSLATDLTDDIVRIVAERIPERYGLDPIRDVQVLAPQYKGPAGIDALHTRLREALCPNAEAVMNGRFRVGEKVIATRTIAEAEIANGTIFIVDSAKPEAEELLLETETGDLLPLPYSDTAALRGGFCASVHKAQGFEIPAVVVCLHSTHAPQLLSRNLLYTAVTRAQQLCVLAGDERALRRALANTDALERHSRLGARLGPA